MKNNRILFIGLFFLTLLWAGEGFGQSVRKDIWPEVKEVSLRFLKREAPEQPFELFKGHWPDSLQGACLVRLKPAGFLIVRLSEKPSVVAFSLHHRFGAPQEERSVLNGLVRDVVSRKPGEGQTKTTQVEKTWGPFVHTLWGQVNCYDENNYLINVTNLFTPHNYAAGCVAISLSTLMHYYKWPVVGTRSYTYTDSKGSSTGTYSADFKNTYYDWADMLDRYRYKRSSTKQREAAGELAFHAAVALHTDFESNGSTSNVNRIPAAGRNYFRFNGIERTPSSSSFWTLLNTNISHNIPVVLALKNNSGGGHSVVCDGLKIDENGNYFYHLNMGWWGTSNGWYKIHNTWNAGGYTTVTDGVFYFLPNPQLLTPYITQGQKSVDVVWHYPDKLKVDAFELQQKINSGLWKTLSNDIHDTTYHVQVWVGDKQYFRVRAEVAGRWSSYGWSNVEMITKDVTDVAKIKKENVRLYPNPVKDKLNIAWQKISVTKVVVYNVLGQIELSSVPVPGAENVHINTGSLKKGIYFIHLFEGKRPAGVFKLIKN